jgi:hypothetical protein
VPPAASSLVAHDVGEGYFRYRTRELHRALASIVRVFGLRTTVDYDDGMGVFVYNLWAK